MGWVISAVGAVILFILVLLLGLLLAVGNRPKTGGALIKLRKPIASPHIVVDTLNLAHRLGKKVDTGSVLAAIDATAPVLRKKYSGHVMYVVKDRESVLNDSEVRLRFAETAKRNSVYIYGVERYGREAESYEDERRSGEAHAARARDDLYMALLARRYKCSVLTEDRFRDFDRFRDEVRPFHVYEFAYWRSLPERDYVKPEALVGLKKPPTVRHIPLLAGVVLKK